MVKPGANVRAISALGDLRGALGQFAGEAQASLQAAAQEIQRTLEWLQERCAYRRAEVRRCQATVAAARCALADCHSRAQELDRNGGGQSDCSAEQAALSAAQAALDKAEAELRNVEQWLQRTQQAADTYRQQARRLQGLATNQIPKAQATLSRKIADLEAYRQIAPPGAAGLPAALVAFTPVLWSVIIATATAQLNSARNAAVRHAKRQELELVQRVGRGTRDWNVSEIRLMRAKGKFPKGYVGHHINNVARFPELAGNPDNIAFVISKEHIQLHHTKNATSGKLFNRKSLMKQWAK